jgi:hypothetical protein
VLREGSLGEDGGGDCSVGAFEGEEERVPLVVDLTAALLLNGLAQDPMVLLESGDIALAQPPQERGRAVDVREEDRGRPGRQLGRSSFPGRLLHVATR